MPSTNPPSKAAGQSAFCTTISFRLSDEDEQRALFERAKQLRRSVHELARDYVQQVLCQKHETDDLWEALFAMNENMKKLREDIATVAKALLSHAGQVDEKEANAWVERNFK